MKFDVMKLLYVILGVSLFSFLTNTCSNSSQSKRLKELEVKLARLDSSGNNNTVELGKHIDGKFNDLQRNTELMIQNAMLKKDNERKNTPINIKVEAVTKQNDVK